jgi:methylmalonyl-CoA/ethylmalonyl-CoA epimerase
MILGIDHIGIATRALDERLPFWSDLLGMDVVGLETVDTEQVKVAFIDAGSCRIELLQATAPESTIAKFVERRGEGIHHLTFRVRDLPALLERLERNGVAILGQGPRSGAGGSSVAFLHPRASGGVLIEFVESEREAQRGAAAIEPGATIVAYLREPQEKLWGLLRRLDASGIVLEGIDLASFDDWVAQLERDEETVVGPSVLFLPMGRVEKILLDRSSGHLASLAERFERRTGRTVQQILGGVD